MMQQQAREDVHVIANPAKVTFNGPEDFKLIVEAPPVTELVTETPLESGTSAVIGGKAFFIGR